MRIWDVHPGYLDRQRLLGEHRELHGVVAVVARHPAPPVRHPEAKRWIGCGWALGQRHRLLAAEMALRGYRDRTPIALDSATGHWPDAVLDPPSEQFAILARKYAAKNTQGRIPLPRTAHELWAHHKYSVLARNQAAYRNLGRRVAALRGRDGFHELASELVAWLRQPPHAGDFANAVQHMRGHVDAAGAAFEEQGVAAALREIQNCVRACRGPNYLRSQTALSELAAWIGVDASTAA